jgi:hypothetical protein
VIGPNVSTEIVFPWLPGEGHRVPDPAWTYRDDPDPPKHVMLTLTMLARGCAPQDAAPVEWLAAINEDALDSPMRAFAREHFGLLDVWNEQSQSYDWLEQNSLNTDGTAVAVPREAALQRCWSGHAQLILDDLAQRGETVAEAVERVPREWRRWTEARAVEFVATWEDAAAWPPALATSWIMFGGKWDAIAAYHENGKFMPVGGLQLELAASLFGASDGEGEPRIPRPLKVLNRAMRLALANTRRVKAFGLLNGNGLMTEISPFDHVLLRWAEESGEGAMLRNPSGAYFAEVHIDAESLQRAFPPKELPPGPQPGEQMKAWLIRRHNLQKGSMEQARAYALEWRVAKGLTTDEESIESQAKSIQVQLTSLSTKRAGK